MARTDTLSNYLTDIATAIKTKKGNTTPINASNFDTEIANLPSGGSEIQGNLVNSYFGSDETLSSGEFISINEIEIPELSVAMSSGYIIDLIALQREPNNVYMLIYFYSNKIYGRICTNNDGVISYGSEKLIYDGAYSQAYIEACLISMNNVIISFIDKTNRYLNAIICTANTNSISVGTATQISSTNYTMPEHIVFHVRTSTEIFIFYPSTSRALCGNICTINGRTITVGTASNITSTSNYCYGMTGISIDADNVLIMYTNSARTLYKNTCYKSGTKLKGSELNFTYGTGGTNIYKPLPFIKEINETIYVLVFFCRYISSTSTYNLCCSICTLSYNSTTIVKEIEIKSSILYNYLSTEIINNHIFTIYKISDTSIGILDYGINSDLSIIDMNSKKLSYYSSNLFPYIIKENDNNFLILKGENIVYGKDWEGMPFEITKYNNINQDILGVVKNVNSEEHTAEIYIPNYEEE